MKKQSSGQQQSFFQTLLARQPPGNKCRTKSLEGNSFVARKAHDVVKKTGQTFADESFTGKIYHALIPPVEVLKKDSASYLIGNDESPLLSPQTALAYQPTLATQWDAYPFEAGLNLSDLPTNNGKASFSVSGAAIIDAPTVNETLRASANSADPDGDGSFHYSWQIFNGSSWDNVGSDSSYKITFSDEGKKIRLVVDYIDAEDFAEQVLTPAGTVAKTLLYISSISVRSNLVSLTFSKPIQATGLPLPTSFKVQTISSNGYLTNKTISSISYDASDPTGKRIHLKLSGIRPASNEGIQVNYIDPAPTADLQTGVIQDLQGNDLATTPTSIQADTFISSASVSSLATLASNYMDLVLSGTAWNGTANANDNKITGNDSNNILSGLAGKDTIDGHGGADLIIGGRAGDRLTGGLGNDTFRLALADSRLADFDIITDFTINDSASTTPIDKLDGPLAISALNINDGDSIYGVGTVNTLSESEIQGVLDSANFLANRGAVFTCNDTSGLRTFVALNNGTAGYQANGDAIIEITGYIGSLANLAVI